MLLPIVSYNLKNQNSEKSNISFRANSVPSEKTMRYLKSLKPDKLRLSCINRSKIKDIFKGIPIFEGIKVKDIFTKNFVFDSILIQRGCMHQCIHCAAESSKKIRTMAWDNYTKIVDGVSILSKRLGFNPFSDSNAMYLYNDSDPMIYRSKGADGKYRNIFDAAKYLYKKTGKKTVIQTAGWLSGFSQKAAEGFVKDSSMLDCFGISIHPFHKYMERSIQAHMKGNTKEANKWRNMYTDMIANNIKTTISLKNEINYGIVLEYVGPMERLADERRRQYYNEKSVQKLYNEILNKLKLENFNTKDLKIRRRNIQLLGKGSNLGQNSISESNFKEKDWFGRVQNTISIDINGDVILNPYKYSSMFFKPKPFIDSKKKPLKLNFG